ncbi:MAG: tetratricopeptide repeat protein [Proteobacteria bacterium]|nr:tetratricopeptide repeat protein [Pseudomonadota bacterium]
MSGLFTELKRRNVFRVAVVYLIAGWIILQVADIMMDALNLPEWTLRLIVTLLMLGFPVAVILAWALEITPEGIKREKHVDRSQSITGETGRKINQVTVILLAVAVGFLLVERFTLQRPASEPIAESGPASAAGAPTEQSTISAPDRSIAVIPFASRGGDGADDSFAEGIHDDLLTQLGKIGALKVISRTSVMQYKDTQKSIPQIARELGVATVLEGGVQRAGDRIRINMQLIDAVTDKHLWAETYDRDLSVTSIFDIQSDIAHAVSRALQASLTADEESRLSSLPTGSLAAYDAFSRGKLLLPDRTTAALKQAERSFREAIALDPEYAEAYAGLADTLGLQASYLVRRQGDYLDEAGPIIEQALALDPLLGEAYIARATWLANSGELASARESFARGVSLSPGYAPGHHWYGNRLVESGHLVEGIAQLRIAHELDPQSGIITSNLAEHLQLAGQADEGWRLCNELIAQRPAYSRGHQCLRILARSEGKIADAIRHNRRSLELDPGNPGFYILHGSLLADLGLWDDSEAWFDAQPATIKRNAGFRAGLGTVYYYQGQYEKALAAAREALEIDPRSFPALSLLAALDLNDERNLGALEALSSVYVGLTGPAPEVDANIAEHAMLLSALLAQAGRTEQAEKIATAAEKSLRHLQGWVPFYYAQALILLGREAEAVDSLRRAIRTESLGNARWNVLVSPIFEKIRGKQEYQDIFDALESHLSQQRDLYLASRSQ